MTVKVESCKLTTSDLLLGRTFGQVTTSEFERESATDYELTQRSAELNLRWQLGSLRSQRITTLPASHAATMAVATTMIAFVDV